MADAEIISSVATGSKRPLPEDDSAPGTSKRPRQELMQPSEDAPSKLLNQDSQAKDNDAKHAGSADTQKEEGKRAKVEKNRRGKRDGHKAGRFSGGRRKERGEASTQAGAAAAGANVEGDADAGPKSVRLPKRHCAVLIGFCGTGCNGMQIQRDVRTIEGVLFEAMVKAGAVSEDNADDPVKVSLQRAARTDAGVHAAGNVVSLKMITSFPDVIDRINDALPPEIRVWDYVRVQGSFNARTTCDSRKYTYFFPSYLLIPPKPGSALLNSLEAFSIPPSQQQPPHLPDYTASSPPEISSAPPEGSSDPASTSTSLCHHPFWDSSTPVSSTMPSEDLARKRSFRMPPESVAALRQVAKHLEGTHNFHNFTVGRTFGERQSQRYMKRIEVCDPQVYGETEWTSVLFHGQSFMLHQRKMMTMLVMTARMGAPPRIIEELYGPRRVFVPKMPALGLLLEAPIFDTYNAKVGALAASAKPEPLTPDHADFRPPIDFEKHRERIEAFKTVQIYERMREAEERGGMFDAWIRSLDNYNGHDLAYFNRRGVIPTEAVYKREEKRVRPFKERKKFDATGYVEVEEKDVVQPEDEGSGGDEAEEAELKGVNLAELEG